MVVRPAFELTAKPVLATAPPVAIA